MNTLTKITLTQFRNYARASFTFPQTITCITGPNGSGKTNLLDAVYYLCYTKSYFSASQQHTAQSGTDGFRVEGAFKGERTEVITCKWQAGKKEIAADGVAYERPADHIGKYAAVMIAPDDMELINGGSEGRRKWIDGILSQTGREYLDCLLQYQRVLLQRNAWLKQQAFQPDVNAHTLDYYNMELDRCGTYLFEQRRDFLVQFVPLLDQFYHQLSAGRESVAIVHDSALYERPLADWLRRSLQGDLRVQRTQYGVHRDDLDFRLGEHPLRRYGSQGQKKSFLFALKLAQYAWLSMEQGHLPILLLDDIFEKLDQRRMEALLRIIQGPAFGQVILTDTHPERVKAAFGEEAELGFIYL